MEPKKTSSRALSFKSNVSLVGRKRLLTATLVETITSMLLR